MKWFLRDEHSRALYLWEGANGYVQIWQEYSEWFGSFNWQNFTLIEIAIALHVLAIITYRVLKGQNLLLPMITGKKRLPGATRAPRMMHPILALAVLVFSALAVVFFLLVLGFIP